MSNLSAPGEHGSSNGKIKMIKYLLLPWILINAILLAWAMQAKKRSKP
jgi:hypothetical protein